MYGCLCSFSLTAWLLFWFVFLRVLGCWLCFGVDCVIGVVVLLFGLMFVVDLLSVVWMCCCDCADVCVY